MLTAGQPHLLRPSTAIPTSREFRWDLSSARQHDNCDDQRTMHSDGRGTAIPRCVYVPGPTQGFHPTNELRLTDICNQPRQYVSEVYRPHRLYWCNVHLGRGDPELRQLVCLLSNACRHGEE